MKKLILVSILACLALVPGLSIAGSHSVGVTMATMQSPSYLFSWDAESNVANLSSGTVTATVTGDPTLSTDYAASPTQSLKATGSYDFYRFSGTTLFSPSGGVIRVKFYGNYTAASAAPFTQVYGDASNSFLFVNATTDRLQVTAKLSGVQVYFMSSNNAMLPGQWNDIVLTYSNNGSVTDWAYTINGSAAGSGSTANVWNPAVTPVRLDVGSTTGTVPTGPNYVDDVVIE